MVIPVVYSIIMTRQERKLNEKSIEELHQWYYSIKDILLHNQTHLKTFSIMNPFENALNDIKKFYTTQTY